MGQPCSRTAQKSSPGQPSEFGFFPVWWMSQYPHIQLVLHLSTWPSRVDRHGSGVPPYTVLRLSRILKEDASLLVQSAQQGEAPGEVQQLKAQSTTLLIVTMAFLRSLVPI